MDTITSAEPASLEPASPAPGSPEPASPASDPAVLTSHMPDSPVLSSSVLASPVLCSDGLRRCPWALSGPHVLADHDGAWGRSPSSASGWLRALSLEILQAGLAPGAAVSRLPALEEVFAGFDPGSAALLDDDAVDELLLDRRLIRNRAKVTAVVLAARAARTWGPDHWAEATAPEGEPGSAQHLQAVVRRLQDSGIVHAGPGTVARLLARTGQAPAHVDGCFRC